MSEFSNHAVLSMSDSTMAVSSKYTQDLSIHIVSFTFSFKWFLCFYFWAVIWAIFVDLFAGLHELASASARTLLKLASSVRALLKPYGATLNGVWYSTSKSIGRFISLLSFKWPVSHSVNQLKSSIKGALSSATHMLLLTNNRLSWRVKKAFSG